MSDQELKKLAKQIDDAITANKLSQARRLTGDLLKLNRSAGLAYQGVIALRESKLVECERALVESYTLNNKQTLALANLVPLYNRMKDYKKAVAYGEQAIQRLPDNRTVIINYAASLLQEQSYQKVIELLEPHLDINNPDVQILSGLISAYRSTFNYDKAHELLAIADDKFSEYPDIARLKADTYAEYDPEKALQAFQDAIKKKSNVPTLWNMSLVQLRLGDFKNGWVNYDNGLSEEVGKIGRPIPTMFAHVPKITDLALLDKNKWTFTICEQGIGDQVLFLGALKEMQKDYPKLALICERRMAPIMARSFPGVIIHEYGIGQILDRNLTSVNGVVPIGSIQKKYRNSRQAYIKHRKPYIVPDEKKVEAYRAKLLEKIGDRKIIGFSWKGGFWERAQKTKTLEIELWDKLFEQFDDCIFVCLQYGDVSKEKKYLTNKFKNIRFIDGIDFKKDLDSWLALACACDEIVSVSTALVHFAGAAGKRIHLLLSDKGAPFIWQLEGNEAICYPNISIYRKKSTVSFTKFFTDVAKKMRVA